MKACLKLFLVILIFGKLNPLYAKTDSVKSDLVNHISIALSKYYYFQTDVQRISDSIKRKFENNEYEGLDYHAFASQLTIDLVNISGQKHFEIKYHGQDSLIQRTSKFRKWLTYNKFYWKIKSYLIGRQLRKDCFDYGQIELLSGNIGYLAINDFGNKYTNRHIKRKRISSILRKFNNTESIIIDLRNNEGGYLDQVAYLLSFFSIEGKYIFSTRSFTEVSFQGYDRNSLITRHYYIPKNNRKKLKQKVYLLTSNNTFSAGEFAAYLMQKHANAMLIGEKTAGSGMGVNIGYSYNDFSFDIPSYESVDTSNKMFSKVSGITPDLLVKSDSAFLIAYKLAAKKGKNLSEAEFTKGLEQYSAEFDNLILQDDFGNIKILKKDDELFIKCGFSTIEKLEKININTYRWRNGTFVKFISTKENNRLIEIYWKNRKMESYRAW